MENGLCAKINSGMVCPGTGVTEQDHISRLNVFFHPDKTVVLHIVQVEFFTVPPPVIMPLKVRQTDTGQVICVPEQAVTVCDTMNKLPAQQSRYRLIPVNLSVTNQQPLQPAVYLHCSVCAAQIRLTTGMTVNHSNNLAPLTSTDKIIKRDSKMVFRIRRLIPARQVLLTLLITDNQAARFPGRIRLSVRQNGLFNHKNPLRCYLLRREVDTNAPIRDWLFRSLQSGSRLPHLSFTGSLVGLPHSSATGGPV